MNFELAHWQMSIKTQGLAGPGSPLALQEAAAARRVTGSVSLQGEIFRADFLAEGHELNARPKLSKTEPVWGLWDSDVCEVFLSSAQREEGVAGAPYFEFQVSPFAQFFELKIFEPRNRADEHFRSGLKVSAKILTTHSWQGSIEISLSALGIHRDGPLFGGLFACLGRARPPEGRRYYALHLPAQGQPDFHVPAAFTRFVLE